MLRWLAIALCAAPFALSPLRAADAADEFSREIHPILEKHCYDCHNEKKHKGDLNLTLFDDLEKVHGAQEVWQSVFERVQAFEMPPEGKNELSFDKQRKLVDWLKRLPKPENLNCDQIASDRNANFYRGYVMSRRINRAEYGNTIRDLFGVKIETGGMLPADGGGGEGFDTLPLRSTSKNIWPRRTTS